MIAKQELELILRDFFSERLDLPKAFAGDMDLSNAHGFNSMLVVEVILLLEEHLQTEIPESYYALDHYRSLQTIINCYAPIINTDKIEAAS